MAPWKPSLIPGVDLRQFPLTPAEGFVASRLDGMTDLHGITLLTGFVPEKVEEVLRRLVSLGAVAPEAGAPPPIAATSSVEFTPPPIAPMRPSEVRTPTPIAKTPAPAAAAKPREVNPPAPAGVVKPRETTPAPAAVVKPREATASGGVNTPPPSALASDLSTPPRIAPTSDLSTPPPVAPLNPSDVNTPPPIAPLAHHPTRSASAPGQHALKSASHDQAVDDPGASHSPDEDPAQDEAQLEAALGTHRKLYANAMHGLTADERAARAQSAQDSELSALCFDPLPAVIHALLDNPRFGLPHARLVARHHGNPAGLDALGAKAQLMADAGVRRALVRNPQLPTGLFRRLYAARRLLEQYQLTLSRELPEQTRRTARELLRARFTTAPAEERVELIIKSEGRCLTALSGLAVDSKTTALLCGRTYASTMLVQNISRWSAAPPALISHLLRQDIIRRSPMLRTLLLRHPNAPKEK